MENNLSRVELRARGWTEALIRDFLGNPDETRTIAHRANFRGCDVWSIHRVAAAEKTEEFVQALALSLRRRKTGRKDAKVMEGLRAQPLPQVLPETQTKRVVRDVAAVIEDARRRGFRTPNR